MKLKDEKFWKETVEKNNDPYGGCCVQYAKCWAELMEGQYDEKANIDVFLANNAKALSHEANKDYGITGFMYGCAVEILSRCWIHGEALRKWHNLDTQIKDEGEKANKEGGVLNPAILNIG